MIFDKLFRKSTGGSRILNSQDLARYLEGRSRSGSGVNVTPARALQYAAVFACVRVLAETVGQLPLHLYEKQGRGKAKAEKHPLYSLLHDAPNEYQTAQEWREWVIAGLALYGNSYCQIIRVRDQVAELQPLAYGAVTVKQGADLELTYDVTLKDGGRVTLGAADVLHLKLFPLDGIMGASPVRYARESIGLGIATEQHGAGLFANGAMPGGVLESEKILSEQGVTNLRNSWEERHSGEGNAGRVAVLEDGVKWKGMAMPSTDAQFLENRKYQRSEIAGIFRVPPHLIGDLERATFSNIEHQGLDFTVHGLMPYLTRIESRFALQLLSESERATYFAKFQVGGLLRGDMQARAGFYTQMVQNGAMSPNEIRELEDQNPREGGDIYLTPANMVINGQVPKTDPKKPPPE